MCVCNYDNKITDGGSYVNSCMTSQQHKRSMMDHILDKNTLSIVMDYCAQLTHSEKFTSALVDIADPYKVWISRPVHVGYGALFHCPCGSGLSPTIFTNGTRSCEKHDDDTVKDKIVINYPRTCLYLRHVYIE